MFTDTAISKILRGCASFVDINSFMSTWLFLLDAGVSLSVMGGLQDELFNFTLQHFVVHDVFTDSEIKARLPNRVASM